MTHFDATLTAMMRGYEDEVRIQVETPMFATEAQRDFVRRRNWKLWRGIDWDMLVAPRLTRFLRRHKA